MAPNSRPATAASTERDSSRSRPTAPASRSATRRPRLQLEFSPEAFERLAELKEMSVVRTNAEVIRRALHIYDWVLTRTRAQEYRLQLVKGDEVREVELV